ncbi:MAG: gliding motility protein GldL [Prevotella sp.]|nr:gliding motility protein GldL [Prevotella sp.]
MTEYSKLNVIYRLQKWLDSVPGQTFLNYAYSWGAAIVILGTLFKLTHLPGANIMLYLGMGTEVIVFFISAFDRPFDKTAIGKELPTHVSDEDEMPVDENEQQTAESVLQPGGVIVSGGALGGNLGGTILTGGNDGMGGFGNSSDQQGDASVDGAFQTGGALQTGGNAPAGGTVVIGGIGGQMVPQQAVNDEMQEATNNYVEELKRLTEMLGKVAEQSQRLTRDSEEMENLNRTLTGICKVYEMQLKGASAQIGTIDQINEQSRKMAEQIGELNKIYARMIEAMTANMKGK